MNEALLRLGSQADAAGGFVALDGLAMGRRRVSDLPDARQHAEQTLGDLVAVYLEDRLRRGEIRPITVRDNRYTLNQFAEVAGGRRPVEHLGPSDIERSLGSIGGLGAGDPTGKVLMFKGYCQWLVRQRHIQS